MERTRIKPRSYTKLKSALPVCDKSIERNVSLTIIPAFNKIPFFHIHVRLFLPALLVDFKLDLPNRNSNLKQFTALCFYTIVQHLNSDAFPGNYFPDIARTKSL